MRLVASIHRQLFATAFLKKNYPPGDSLSPEQFPSQSAFFSHLTTGSLQYLHQALQRSEQQGITSEILSFTGLISLWQTTKPLKYKETQWRWARVTGPWSLGNNAECDTPQLLQRKLTLSQQQGIYWKLAFVLNKQLLKAELISWWFKCFSLSSLKKCECLPGLGQ